ncbi:MAG: PilZ domain-containing protein [Desulfamplus sp.]|nr:PilZ domain-containing protein [Desulfamplus sp.]
MLDNILNFLKKRKRASNRKRASARLQFEVMFSYHYENRTYMGLLKDISVNGLGFFSANYVEAGKEIEVEVVVDCKEPDADLKWVALKEKAKIRWVGINHSSKLIDYDIGCEFIEPDNETREKLTTILNQMLKK